MYETHIIVLAVASSIILVVLIYNVSTKTKHNSELDRFTNKIPVVTGIFVALGVYLTYSVLNLNVQQMHINTTLQLVDRGWITLNKELVEKQSLCPNLVESFLYPWQKKEIDASHRNTVTKKHDDLTASYYIAAIIFQAWENFFLANAFVVSESAPWVTCFLQYAKSPLLRRLWMAQRSLYSSVTRNFGNILFDYASRYSPQNEKELKDLTQLIIKDPEYIKLGSAG